MTAMDGYELCRLIRQNPMFKDTPVVMMTTSKGIIDRMRAGIVGASGLFTKPFNTVELQKMVFTHLT
jgi:twitching motility two-component system response regulator PilG